MMTIPKYLFQHAFQQWWNQRDLDHSIISYSIVASRPRLFCSEDARKTAESDQYDEEKSHHTSINKESVEEYLEKRFNEEIDWNEISSPNDIDQVDLNESFDIWYEDWMNEQVYILSQEMEPEF